MKNTVIFEGEVNGVKVNTVEEYNKLIKEHLNKGTLESASSSTRVEEQENQDKPKVVFEGEVNGVKVNTVEEYNKLIMEHVNNGTLKSASSSTRVEEQEDDDNPFNQLVGIDPKFNGLLDIIIDTLSEKYLNDKGKLTKDFYKDFHSELKKLIQDTDNSDMLNAIADALDDTVEFYDQVYEDYIRQLGEVKQELVKYLTNVVKNTDEDIISTISKDDNFEQLRKRHNNLVSHTEHCSRWANWTDYMYNEIIRKL